MCIILWRNSFLPIIYIFFYTPLATFDKCFLTTYTKFIRGQVYFKYKVDSVFLYIIYW